MNKSEAANYLEVSKRAIERYVKAGKLSVFYSKGKNGLEARYRQEELDALKEEMKIEVHRSCIESGPVDNSLTSIHESVPDEVDDPLNIERWLMTVVNQLIVLLAAKPSPLSNYEQLELAVSKQWILSSSALENLIGVRPRGKSFVRGSFCFSKQGKIGRESGWIIKKSATVADLQLGEFDEA